MAKSHHDYYNVNVDANVNADVNLKLVVAPELLHPEVGRHDLVLQVLKKKVSGSERFFISFQAVRGSLKVFRF